MIHIKGYLQKQCFGYDYIERPHTSDIIIKNTAVKNTIPLYDSSYDFDDFNNYGLNPKELIGQEVTFDELNDHYSPDTSSLTYPPIHIDTIYTIFSSSVVTPLSEITRGAEKDTMRFNLVDGSRNCQRQEDGLLLMTDHPTTNTYKPVSVITNEGAYPDSIYKSNILIGTHYRSLAGRTFIIKNVTAVFDYYDSRNMMVYTLLDNEKREIMYVSNELTSLIHIKGYLKKIQLHDTGKKFKLRFQTVPNANWIPPVFDSLTIQAYLVHSNGTLSYYRKRFASHDQLQFISIQYINIDHGYTQSPAFEFLTKDKEKVWIPYGVAMIYLPPSFSSRKNN